MDGWDIGDLRRARDEIAVLVDSLPDADVQSTEWSTAYRVRGRVFARLLADHHGDGRLALWVKADRDERDGLVEADPGRYFVPPYVGPSGWLGVDLAPAAEPDWEGVAAFVEAGWRMSAGKRAVAAYDAARD